MSGMLNLAKVFQTPEVSTDSATFARLNPCDEYSLYVSPMPTALPPGTVLVTAVESRFTSIACRRLEPGSDATRTNQQAVMFQIAASTRRPMPMGLISPKTAQTCEMSAICGSA